MLRRLFKDLLIITGGSLFFLMLCATAGISMSTPPAAPTAEAAHKPNYSSEDQVYEDRSFHGVHDLMLDYPAD